MKNMKRPNGPYHTSLLEIRGRSLAVFQTLAKVDSSNKFVSALEGYSKSLDLATFNAMKLIVFGCKEKIGNAQALAKIRAAIGASIASMITTFMGMTLENMAQPGWIDQMTNAKDICGVFSIQVFALIADPTEDDLMSKLWQETFVAKMKLLLSLASLQNLGDEIASQVESDENNENY